MKHEAQVRYGYDTSDHEIEVLPGGDDPKLLRVIVDGEETVVNCTEFRRGLYSILIGNDVYEAVITGTATGSGTSNVAVVVSVGDRHREYEVAVRDPRVRRYGAGAGGPSGPLEIAAPMPGRVVKVLVTEGQQVKGGAGLVVIEAMKMQNELRAPRAGVVEKVYVTEGAGAEAGAKLVLLA
jgi:biotin carboxyl carrier protein